MTPKTTDTAKPAPKPKRKVAAAEGAPAPAPVRDVMTVAQIAAYLQLSERTIYAMAKAGTIPAVQFGDTWRFAKSVIDTWLGVLSAGGQGNYRGPRLPGYGDQ